MIRYVSALIPVGLLQFYLRPSKHAVILSLAFLTYVSRGWHTNALAARHRHGQILPAG